MSSLLLRQTILIHISFKLFQLLVRTDDYYPILPFSFSVLRIFLSVVGQFLFLLLADLI